MRIEGIFFYSKVSIAYLKLRKAPNEPVAASAKDLSPVIKPLVCFHQFDIIPAIGGFKSNAELLITCKILASAKDCCSEFTAV